MSFRLSNATIHYGASSYPINFAGWPAGLQRVKSRDELLSRYQMLVDQVGMATGFPREFNLIECPAATYDLDNGAVLTVPQRIVAIANGYTLTWNKEPTDDRS